MWDFAAPNQGATLVDCAALADVPWYLAEKPGGAGGYVDNSINDLPKIPLSAGPIGQFLNDVRPAVGKTTDVDVMYSFVTYGTVAFNDKSIYCIGQQAWNVRLAGAVTQPNANVYQFQNDGKVTPSDAFAPGVRNNANPVAIGPTVANGGVSAWR
jgi:hypothetical protein